MQGDQLKTKKKTIVQRALLLSHVSSVQPILISSAWSETYFLGSIY